MAASVLRSQATYRTLGAGLAGYLKLVRATSKLTIAPDDMYERVMPHWPFIVAMWHGQHFLTPFLRRGDEDVRVLISRHGDGEINAIAAQKLGLGLIRGSGATRAKKMHKKGSVAALREMVRALDDNATVALTADVPKGPARIAGAGIVTLARLSGRPIIPFAVATSRYITMNSWDKAALNLPFSRMAMTAGEVIEVPSDLGSDELPGYQERVKAGLDTATEHAYDIVHGRHPKP